MCTHKGTMVYESEIVAYLIVRYLISQTVILIS